MSCKSIFVTATGTDVGKTYVSGLLLKKMLELGNCCGYYKPVLSGATKMDNGSLLPGDCDYVVNVSGLNVNPSDCVTYCFEEALSPHLASERLGIKINKKVIEADFDNKRENYDYLVVEGAGGITCPFYIGDEVLLLSDVVSDLGLGLVVVADAGLGTINSILLTVEYAKTHNLTIKGIILNKYDENNFMHIDNKKQVELLTGIRVIATVKNKDNDLDINEKDLLEIFA